MLPGDMVCALAIKVKVVEVIQVVHRYDTAGTALPFNYTRTNAWLRRTNLRAGARGSEHGLKIVEHLVFGNLPVPSWVY